MHRKHELNINLSSDGNSYSRIKILQLKYVELKTKNHSRSLPSKTIKYKRIIRKKMYILLKMYARNKVA